MNLETYLRVDPFLKSRVSDVQTSECKVLGFTTPYSTLIYTTIFALGEGGTSDSSDSDRNCCCFYIRIGMSKIYHSLRQVNSVNVDCKFMCPY